MAFDQPDFWRYRPRGPVYPVLDLAELAARLGNIDTFDRRGDVIWLDDFEGGISKWVTGGSGLGYAVATSTVTARNGGYSMKLKAGYTASMYAYASHYMPKPVLGPIGLEVWVAFGSDMSKFEIWLDVYDGTQHIRARIRWVPSEQALQYRDENDVWADVLTGVSLVKADYFFHGFKLVADFDKQKYVRVILNDTEIDMSGIAMPTSASLLAPQLVVTLYNYGFEEYEVDSYVDDVIITQNEP